MRLNYKEFHSNTKPIVQDKQQNIQKSVLQTKKINRLRELARKSEDSIAEEVGASNSKEKPHLKRLMRRSSTQRNDSLLEPSSNNNFNGNIIGISNNNSLTNDFYDPEDDIRTGKSNQASHSTFVLRRSIHVLEPQHEYLAKTLYFENFQELSAQIIEVNFLSIYIIYKYC